MLICFLVMVNIYDIIYSITGKTDNYAQISFQYIKRDCEVTDLIFLNIFGRELKRLRNNVLTLVYVFTAYIILILN